MAEKIFKKNALPNTEATAYKQYYTNLFIDETKVFQCNKNSKLLLHFTQCVAFCILKIYYASTTNILCTISK